MNKNLNSWTDKTHHPADLLLDHWKEIKTRWGKPKEFSISFLPELDKAIWGLKRRTLTVVAGRPSMGKSTLLLNMAYSFAEEGKKVYFFSLEMSKEECLERLICNACSIENSCLHTGKIGNGKYENEIKCFGDTLEKMDLMIVESWGRTFDEILQIIDNYEKPDAIFIDYVNMVKSGNLSQKGAIDEYIKDLRNLALDKNFCAVLGAQINRDIYKAQDMSKEVPVPNIWHLKDSGNLEQVSDLVMIVHWPHYYRFTKDEGIDDEKEFLIKVAKNRSGRTGIFVGDFLPQYYRITSREKAPELVDRGID